MKGAAMENVATERNRLKELMYARFGEFKAIVLGGRQTIPVAKSPRDLMEEYLAKKFGPNYRPERPRTDWPRRNSDSSEALPRPRTTPNTPPFDPSV